MPDSLKWVRLRDDNSGKPYYWNRRTRRLPGTHRLASRWCGSARGMRGEWSGTGTGTRVSPRLSSLLFFLGEELYRQSRAVYKYWAGGLRSCDHAATSSSSSSSSTSDSVHRQNVGHSSYATETGIRSATEQVAGSVHSCFLSDEVAAALVVEIGSCIVRSWFCWCSCNSCCAPFGSQDLRHLGRYGPEGLR